MTELKKSNELNFDFSRVHTPEIKNNIKFEEKFALFFIVIFSCFFIIPFLTTSTKQVQENSLIFESNDIVYSDYQITENDKTMLSQIFNYDTQHNVKIPNKNFLAFQKEIKKADLLNNPFDNNKQINIKSEIVSIEPVDKAESVKNYGETSLDYIDVVVQKTYSQKNKVIPEMQLITIALDKHEIHSMITNRMVD